MSTIKPHEYDPETWDDQEDSPTFQRVQKQTGKPSTRKGDRRQASKEFGKRVDKFLKERRRYEGEGKP